MVLGAIQGGIGMLLAGRMAWISIAENEHYELLSESNRVNLTLVPPRRGWIVDRYGKPLANNKTDFRVDIIPDRLHHQEATLASLARSAEHTSELQSLMRTSYAVFCLHKNKHSIT